MPYDAKRVANWFLAKGDSERTPINLMKLQKLVYFAHGWSLALMKQGLVDEPIYAWQWGPVVKSLYDEFKRYGNQPIMERASTIGWFDFPQTVPAWHRDTISLLNRVWEVYGEFTGIQLSNMTHMPDAPWQKVYERLRGDVPPSTEIPESEIKSYFERLAETSAHAREP